MILGIRIKDYPAEQLKLTTVAPGVYVAKDLRPETLPDKFFAPSSLFQPNGALALKKKPSPV